MDRLEKINQARKEQGQEPLKELPNSPQGTTTENENSQNGTKAPDQSPETKPENLPNKPETTPAPENKPGVDEPAKPGSNTPAPQPQPTPSKSETELSDEQLLEILNKRSGIKINSLEDLAPKEDPKAVAEKREVEKVVYGLQKNLFSKAEYDSYVADDKDRLSLVYRQFYQEAKKEDSAVTDPEIQKEFNEKFGLDEDEGSRKYKRGQTEIKILSEEILKSTYPKIYSLETEYSKHETNVKSQATKEKQILTNLPKFTADVESIFESASMKKFVSKLEDNEQYEVDISQDTLNSIKAKLLDNDFATSKALQGWKKEDIEKIAQTMLLQEAHSSILNSVVKQAILKRQAGSKGVPAPIGGQNTPAPVKKVSEKQQKVLDEAGYKLPGT